MGHVFDLATFIDDNTSEENHFKSVTKTLLD